MYRDDCRVWAEVECVIVVVCMVIGDEGCEVVDVVNVEDCDRVEKRVR